MKSQGIWLSWNEVVARKHLRAASLLSPSSMGARFMGHLSDEIGHSKHHVRDTVASSALFLSKLLMWVHAHSPSTIPYYIGITESKLTFVHGEKILDSGFCLFVERSRFPYNIESCGEDLNWSCSRVDLDGWWLGGGQRLGGCGSWRYGGWDMGPRRCSRGVKHHCRG